MGKISRQELNQDLNTELDKTGLLSDLTTTAKTTIVAAINEVKGKADSNKGEIGTLANLTTADKDSIVDAVNEVQSEVNTNATNIGTLTNLATVDKDSMVDAINEETSRRKDFGVNVKDFGAIGDGVANDTIAIQNAIDSLSAGQKLLFPPGIFLCNINILKSQLTMMGNRGQGQNGSYLKPYDMTKPCISIGDGSTDVVNLLIENVCLQGTRDVTHTSSVGIKINGATYVYINDVMIESFGGNNIELTSSATRATSYIYFNNLRTSTSRRSNFYMEYGASATAAVYINGLISQSYSSPESRALTVNECTLHITNGWIQGSDSKGIDMVGLYPFIRASNLFVDSDNSNDVLVNMLNIDAINISGTFNIDGLIKYSNASTVRLKGTGFIQPETALYTPVILGSIFLKDQSFADTASSNNDRIYKSGTKTYFLNNGKQFFFDGATGALRNIIWEFGATANRPASPVAGYRFFDTTLKKPIWHDGTNWIQSDGSLASRIVGFGIAAPITGTFSQGDIFWNTTPPNGGIGYWLCTTSGTPGTWTPVQIGIMSSISAAPLFVGQRAVVGGIAYFAIGTSAATDWVRITEPKENGGISSQNGTGAVTAFTIAHGLGTIPTFFQVTANSVDAKGDFYVTADATNLTVTYTTAPITGTVNVKLSWFARV